MPSSSPERRNGLTQAWEGLIKVAGATTGLTVLTYFVGAATTWARFKAAKLPADIGVEHHARGELLALGVRGIVAIAAILIVFAAGMYTAALSLALLLRVKKSSREAKNLGKTHVIELGTCAVHRLDLGHFRLLGALATAALIGAAFSSWHVFATAVALTTFVGVTLRYLRERRQAGTRPSLMLIVTTVLGAGIAGIAWQLQAPVRVQTVVVVPERNFVLKNVPNDVPVPYLGETSDHVFVAEIVRPRRAGGRWNWTYTHRILELPRGSIRLIFPGEKGTLYSGVKSPMEVLWAAIT